MELLHDEDAYDHIFGKDYPVEEGPANSNNDSNSSGNKAGKISNKSQISTFQDHQKPIEYLALVYPIPFNPEDTSENQD